MRRNVTGGVTSDVTSDVTRETPVDAAALRAAADALAQADGVLITAGAGIGVDSGLPDFRGPAGFWRAYPALGTLGLRFEEVASPATFVRDPALAWGFYGHRLALYRCTVPHDGFARLMDIARTKPHGAFVFTSNVDGQFRRAGFDPARIVECHGTIHRLQCLRPCHDATWPAEGFEPDVDEASCRLRGPLPRCPRCGSVARPAILMFGDGAWHGDETDRRLDALGNWLAGVARGVVVEIGAGTAVPTVRLFGERVARGRRWPMLRIDPDPETGSSPGGGAGFTHLRGGARAMLADLGRLPQRPQRIDY